MSDFMGSAHIISQNEMRDKAQKAINQQAWAAEDAANAAKRANADASNARAELAEVRNKLAQTEEALTLEKQNTQKLAEALEDHKVINEIAQKEMTARYQNLKLQYSALEQDAQDTTAKHNALAEKYNEARRQFAELNDKFNNLNDAVQKL